METLPIDEALPRLVATLKQSGQAVLQAPPGAGKTTRVPLAMLDAGVTQGRIIMLEPRRLAARMAAARMAETLGEPVGQTVGYRIRGEARSGPATRIEVVTEGILTRMIQSDPALDGIGARNFRRIPRTFAERRSGTGLGAGMPQRLARRPLPSGDVGNAGRRTGGALDGCTCRHLRRTQFSGRDPLARQTPRPRRTI